MSCCHAQCASRLRSNPRFSQMPDPETLLDVQKCSSSKACSFWILGESLNIFDMGSGWIRMDQEYHAIERTIIWRTWRTCWIMQWRIVNNTYMDKPPIYRIPLQSITYTQYTLWIFMIYTMHTLHISHVFTCHVYLFQLCLDNPLLGTVDGDSTCIFQAFGSKASGAGFLFSTSPSAKVEVSSDLPYVSNVFYLRRC